MASSHTVDIGGLVGGSRAGLFVEEHVALEPFEGVSFPGVALVHLDVRAASSTLEIAGAIDVDAVTECDRCLGDVRIPIQIVVDEEIEWNRAAPPDPFAESNVLSGDRLDVADLTSQLVYSALPLGRLCGPDCKGLCQRCGANKNQGACGCAPDDGENRGELKMEDPAQ